MADRKQIPALPEATTAADDDFFIKRDTQSGTDEKLAISLLLTRSGEQVDAHAEEQGGIHGIPEGERALHTGTNGGGTPIGGYVTVQTDLTGAEEPDPDTHIKLEAGLTGAGEYNEGKLGSESVTGSAPLVVATAEIVDAESPLNGQTVHLLETERRYLMPGTSPGSVANDQMQQITGGIGSGEFVFPYNSPASADARGVFLGSFGVADSTSSGAGTSVGLSVEFDSADSPGARTGDHTSVKHIEIAVYMRIK